MVKVNTSESRPEGGGSAFDVRCNCHFIVEGWEDHSSKQRPYVDVTFLALASDVESQVGRRRTEAFSLHPKAVGRLLEFACAAGVYTKDRWKADKEAGIDPDINIEAAIGKTLCAPVGMVPFDEEYWTKKLQEYTAAGDVPNQTKAQEQLTKNKGRSFPQIGGDSGFKFFALGDPDSDKIPLDAKELSHFGGINGNLPTNNGGFRKRGTPVAPAGGNRPAPPAQNAATPPAGGANSLI